jgi:hypothetical protein
MEPSAKALTRPVGVKVSSVDFVADHPRPDVGRAVLSSSGGPTSSSVPARDG